MAVSVAYADHYWQPPEIQHLSDEDAAEMRRLYVIFYSIVRFCYPYMSDDEFSRNLQALLALVVPSIEIRERAGITPEKSPISVWLTEENGRRLDSCHAQSAAAYRAHLAALESARAPLVRVRPQWRHRNLHISAIHTSQVYIRTLRPYAMMTHLLAVPSRWEDRQRLNDDAILWNQITHRAAVCLVSDIANSPLMLEIPEGLERIADESFSQFFGSVIPGGGELFGR